MTKIDIFSGFLGAGKTTLIKKMIAESFAGEKLVLIENEFGEIGIDGAFLQEAGIEITEMNSGCICCSLVGDFSKALKKVLDEFHPDRILIEPSGVGKLSDIKAAVSGVLNDEVVINSCVAVVDAKKARVYRKNFGEFYVNQIEAADCVVLSRSQDVSEERLKEVLDMVRELNPEATVVAAPWDTLTGADLLSAIEKSDSLKASLEALKAEHHHHDDDECDDPECECHHHHHHDDEDDDEHECHHHHHHDDDDEDEEHECCHHHHHHDDDDEDEEHEHHHHHHDEDEEHEHHHHHHHHGHDADEVFSSWGFETMHRFTESEIREKIAALDDTEKFGTVLRAKGVVPAADGERWIHFDHVPGEVELRRGPAGVIGRLCVIGSKINEEALKRLFSE
ncbi:MAG: GTP-binding protein [Clostridia bacterium]|nr:GTP-binding protein [Clostridia bacterium]MBR3130404.1 GTP-binding protein [Clostridia bacterium]